MVRSHGKKRTKKQERRERGSWHLLQVVHPEWHARDEPPHDGGQVQVQGLLGPHRHPTQDAQELEQLRVLLC